MAYTDGPCSAARKTLSNNTESCDLIIVCGRKRFAVHKDRLAHNSGFFRQLLHSNTQNLRFCNLISRNEKCHILSFTAYVTWIAFFVLVIQTITNGFHVSFPKDRSAAILLAACIVLLILSAAFVKQEGLIDAETGKSVIKLPDDDPSVVRVILKFIYGSRFPGGSNILDGELHKECGSIDDLARVYVTLDKYDVLDLEENLLGFLKSLNETFLEILPGRPDYFEELAQAFEIIIGARSDEDKFSQFLINLVEDLSNVELNAEMRKLRSDLVKQIASRSIERAFTAKRPSPPKSLTMASFFCWIRPKPSLQSV